VTRIAAVVVGMALSMVAGCGSPASPTAPGGGAPPSGASSLVASGTPPNTTGSSGSSAFLPATSTSPALGGDPRHVTVRLQSFVAGLTAPLFATGAGDGSGRLFVLEQAGRIRLVRGSTLADRPFLDIRDRVASGGERGLLGLAFAPGYASGPHAGRFFVDFTNRDGNTVIAEYHVSATDPDVADPASERVLLTIDQPYANHNGGMLAFGPDGMLYVGMGDGGSGGDPQGNGQRLDTRLGKLLRIDPFDSTRGSPYAIPPGNPFAARTSAEPEIWAYGLRNQWRFSFDSATGDLWIGDVGQNLWEEIDHAAAGTGAGANYGWNRMEGRHCYQATSGCDETGLTLPVAEYGHDQGCAVIGGYVARGAGAGPLSGVYLLSDECSGRIWGLDSAGGSSQDPVLLAETGRAISSFGQDDAGNVYVTDIARGELLRLTGTSR
jgi:glucose/arabinose dehydrogenase